MIEVSIPKDLDEYKVGLGKFINKSNFILLASAGLIFANGFWFSAVLPAIISLFISAFLGIVCMLVIVISVAVKSYTTTDAVLDNIVHFYILSPTILKYEHMDYIAEIDAQITKIKEKRTVHRYKAESKVKKTRKNATKGAKE